MGERYARLFTSPKNIYAEGAPVIIAVGALLLDNLTGKVIVQIKFKSVSMVRIRALKVEIVPMDSAGRILDCVEHNYLDLNINMGEEFGSKEPIVLDDATSRAFTANVTEITFADSSLWSGAKDDWEPLECQYLLSYTLGNKQLSDYFQKKYGNQCRYEFFKKKDLWFCCCGSVNKEKFCYNCGLELATLEKIDYEKFKKEYKLRMKKAQINRSYQEGLEIEKAYKNSKKALITSLVSIILLLILILIKLLLNL